MSQTGLKGFQKKVQDRVRQEGIDLSALEDRQRVLVLRALEGHELNFRERFHVAFFIGVTNDEMESFLDVDLEKVRIRMLGLKRKIFWTADVRARAGRKLEKIALDRGLKPNDLARISTRSSQFYRRVNKGTPKYAKSYMRYLAVLGLEWDVFLEELIDERPPDEDSTVVVFTKNGLRASMEKGMSRLEHLALIRYFAKQQGWDMRDVYERVSEVVSRKKFDFFFDESIERPDHRSVGLYRLFESKLGVDYSPWLLHGALGWTGTRIRMYYELKPHKRMPSIPEELDHMDLVKAGIDGIDWTPTRLSIVGEWISGNMQSRLVTEERELRDKLALLGVRKRHYQAIVEGQPVHLAHLAIVLMNLNISIEELAEPLKLDMEQIWARRHLEAKKAASLEQAEQTEQDSGAQDQLTLIESSGSQAQKVGPASDALTQRRLDELERTVAERLEALTRHLERIESRLDSSRAPALVEPTPNPRRPGVVSSWVALGVVYVLYSDGVVFSRGLGSSDPWIENHELTLPERGK